MFRDAPQLGVPRFDLRTILMALGLVALAFWVAAYASGFHATGRMEPTEQETQEGYFPVGTEFMVVTKPGSPLYTHLLGMRGQMVRLSVEPAE